MEFDGSQMDEPLTLTPLLYSDRIRLDVGSVIALAGSSVMGGCTATIFSRN
jgi:hypothetical protein